MITVEQSERTRKRLEAISERISQSLDHNASPRNSVGIKYETNPDDRCPKCSSGLKRKSGFKNGIQRWECLICHMHYFEKEIRE
jgi:hypothetical protein